MGGGVGGGAADKSSRRAWDVRGGWPCNGLALRSSRHGNPLPTSSSPPRSPPVQPFDRDHGHRRPHPDSPSHRAAGGLFVGLSSIRSHLLLPAAFGGVKATRAHVGTPMPHGRAAAHQCLPLAVACCSPLPAVHRCLPLTTGRPGPRRRAGCPWRCGRSMSWDSSRCSSPSQSSCSSRAWAAPHPVGAVRARARARRPWALLAQAVCSARLRVARGCQCEALRMPQTRTGACAAGRIVRALKQSPQPLPPRQLTLLAFSSAAKHCQTARRRRAPRPPAAQTPPTPRATLGPAWRTGCCPSPTR